MTGSNQNISPFEIEEYIVRNQNWLEEYLCIGSGKYARLRFFSSTPIHVAFYSALRGGVDKESLIHMWTVMTTGYADVKEDYPMVAIRNHIIGAIDKNGVATPSQNSQPFIGMIKKVQRAIRETLIGSCSRRVIEPKDFIYEIK